MRRALVSSLQRCGVRPKKIQQEQHYCCRRLLSTEEKSYSQKNPLPPTHLFIKAGLPLMLFSILSAWVVKNGIEGRQKEADAAKGKVSVSVRQARMQAEHDDMLDKLTTLSKKDFDNTKRIERPEEILERRRKERENRNKWYKRLYRNLVGKE